jgi:hypothetical protein
MCPSATTHGLLHRLAIHLDPPPPGSPSFHLSFECRILVRDSEQSLSSDRAAEDLTALALVVFTTIILAGLDEDPDAVLADGRTIPSSSAHLFLAAIDADSTGVELIAVLDSIAATHSRDYYKSGRHPEREGGDGNDDESMDEPGCSSSSSPASVSRSSPSSSSSSSSSPCSDSHSVSGVGSSERRKAQSIAKVRRAMTLKLEYLVSVEYGDYPVPISSLHTVRLLASISRQEVHHLDTLEEDERDAGSEESGVDSLHMSSDESDTLRSGSRAGESVVETLPSCLQTSLSTSLPQPPHAPYDTLLEVALAAVHYDVDLLSRNDAVNDGLSPDDAMPSRSSGWSCLQCLSPSRSSR